MVYVDECGVAGLFVALEPLASKRIITITQTKTRIDFALFVKELVDIHYRHAEKLVVVMDHLNSHSIASLYAAFPPEEARRLAEKPETHHTPKHASWLNMAEIDISVLARQCLAQPASSIEQIRGNVNPWLAFRNQQAHTIHQHFSTYHARIKLNRLYPLTLKRYLGDALALPQGIAYIPISLWMICMHF